ncbi:MAG TPA: glycosyltransferase family 87 protein [Terracidiphilus sp.]|nr:glycosyltransferase family 87 protein [Terracidiphilus sp.]
MRDRSEAKSREDLRTDSAENPCAGTQPVVKRSAWRKLAASAIIAAGFCWVVFLFAITLTDHDVAGRDYIQYWAEGRQVLNRANPFDAAAILQLERSAGQDRTEAELSGSPPLILLLVTPFALLSAKNGLVLWFAVMLAAFSLSIWVLWLLHGRPDTLLYLFGFLFAPAIACLQSGQISILFLLSILAFLYFLEVHPWLAGACLVPLTLKPHLFLVFAVALLLWTFSRRAYGVLAGFAVALGICLAATFYLDPHAWSQYLQMMKMQNLIGDFVPTLSESMQRLINPRWIWLRFVPAAAACVWAAWYFRIRQNRWSWMHQGMVTLLVSCLCAPYGFFFDESILLPAVLTGMVRAPRSGRSLYPIWIAGAAALIECLRRVRVTSLFYLWTAPAWLIWYLYATKDDRLAIADKPPTVSYEVQPLSR